MFPGIAPRLVQVHSDLSFLDLIKKYAAIRMTTITTTTMITIVVVSIPEPDPEDPASSPTTRYEEQCASPMSMYPFFTTDVPEKSAHPVVTLS